MHDLQAVRSAVGKNKAGKGGGRGLGLCVAVLHSIVREGLSEVVTTEQSLEGCEG